MDMIAYQIYAQNTLRFLMENIVGMGQIITSSANPIIVTSR